jgi:hypothetical protein
VKVLFIQNRLGIFFFKAEQTEIKSWPISSNLSGLRREVGAERLIAAIGVPIKFNLLQILKTFEIRNVKKENIKINP